MTTQAILPKASSDRSSWFDLYRIYSSGNEVPEVYHEWCAVALLSQIIGRRLWVPHGHFDIYPNLYVTLVGPAGVAKSTGISIAKSIGVRSESVRYSGDSVTYQQLVRDVASSATTTERASLPPLIHSSFSIVLSELASLVRNDDEQMMKFLCQMFDAPDTPYEYRTKTQGIDVIERYAVSLLAGCTPQDIPYIFGDRMVGTGLSSRILFVYCDTPGPPVPIPSFTEAQRDARKRLIDWAKMLSALSGEVEIGKDALDAYEKWYLATPRLHDDTRLAGYYSRKRTHMMKLMILSAAGHSRLTIDTSDVVWADRMLAAIEPGLASVMSRVGANKQVVVFEALVQAVKRAHPNEVAFRELIAKHLSLDTYENLLKVLQALVVTGRLSERKEQYNSGDNLIKTRAYYSLGPSEKDR